MSEENKSCNTCKNNNNEQACPLWKTQTVYWNNRKNSCDEYIGETKAKTTVQDMFDGGCMYVENIDGWTMPVELNPQTNKICFPTESMSDLNDFISNEDIVAWWSRDIDLRVVEETEDIKDVEFKMTRHEF